MNNTPEPVAAMDAVERQAAVLEPLRAGYHTQGMGMLAAIQNTRKHVYAGTVDPAEVARRRAANKKARAARKRAHRARKGH